MYCSLTGLHAEPWTRLNNDLNWSPGARRVHPQRRRLLLLDSGRSWRSIRPAGRCCRSIRRCCRSIRRCCRSILVLQVTPVLQVYPPCCRVLQVYPPLLSQVQVSMLVLQVYPPGCRSIRRGCRSIRWCCRSPPVLQVYPPVLQVQVSTLVLQSIRRCCSLNAGAGAQRGAAGLSAGAAGLNAGVQVQINAVLQVYPPCCRCKSQHRCCRSHRCYCELHQSTRSSSDSSHTWNALVWGICVFIGANIMMGLGQTKRPRGTESPND
ncbi:hypothetical protein WMY93_032595 [Mugilogobius chulae]|uniref:Uncharacterized protein n=1 Tax=Mugilogobius chulae TaxID=88201 RepID=A0AAW0MKD8_9GOBI